MANKLINLLIEAQPETRELRLIKKVAPLVSYALLAIFFIVFLISLIFVRIYINNYNKVSQEVDALEKNISSQNSDEALYVTTVGILDNIMKIQAKDTKIVTSTMPRIDKIQDFDTVINTYSIDNQGEVGFSVETANIDTLNNFVDTLKKMETSANFKEIKAAGILRESGGSYSFNGSFKVLSGQKND